MLGGCEEKEAPINGHLDGEKMGKLWENDDKPMGF
jgi:hypothetical protein